MYPMKTAPLHKLRARDNYACQLAEAIKKVRLRLACVNAFANAFSTCDELQPRSAALRDQGAYLNTLLSLLIEEADNHRSAHRREMRHRYVGRLAA